MAYVIATDANMPFFIGVSTETKPEGFLGQKLFERDTQTWYICYQVGSYWTELPNPSSGGGESSISAAESVTISDGVIAPTAPTSMIGNLAVTGEGDTDDALTTITADSGFEGKVLHIRKAGSGTITATNGAGLILAGGNNLTMNSVDDLLVLEWKSANVWREISRASCG